MNHKQFSDLVKLTTVTEAEKAILIAFYLLKVKDVGEFSIASLCQIMVDFGLSKPNQSRLRKNTLFSRAFMKLGAENIKLRLKTIEELEGQYPQLSSKSEEIIAEETVLPEALYLDTRGFLVAVCKQINACYQHNLFDACAMLMRRLIEMLIILTYIQLKREDEIKGPGGGYHSLSSIVNHSIKNKVLGLTKDSEEVIDTFRLLGNHSAHTVEYSCRKIELTRVRLAFRICVEELMYKCGVKK